MLRDSLPGMKVNEDTIEKIKEKHSPQEQTFQLLKLWKQQNKDSKNMIRGMHTY